MGDTMLPRAPGQPGRRPARGRHRPQRVRDEARPPGRGAPAGAAGRPNRAGGDRRSCAIAHALETHKTITGDDIDAIFRGTRGPTVDGWVYHTDDFLLSYEAYHLSAAEAHRRQAKPTELPVVRTSVHRRRSNGVGATHPAAAQGRRRSAWAGPGHGHRCGDAMAEPGRAQHRLGRAPPVLPPTPLLDAEAVTAAVKGAEAATTRWCRCRCSATRPTWRSWSSAPTCASCAASRRALQAAGLDVVDSYVSLTEVSEYAKGMPEEMLEARLYPQLPPEGKPAFCFYPMSKRREVQQNWFTLPYDERKRADARARRARAAPSPGGCCR